MIERKFRRLTSRMALNKLGHFTKTTAQKGKASFIGQVKLCVRFLRNWRDGSYAKRPWRIFVAIVFGLLYFISPIDLVIDFIPFIGYLDDMTVLALIFRFFSRDIKRFKDWEQKREIEELKKQVGDAKKKGPRVRAPFSREQRESSERKSSSWPNPISKQLREYQRQLGAALMLARD